MMRVEVETDLKLPIPAAKPSIPSRPPKEEEKEENSTEREMNELEERNIQFGVDVCVCDKATVSSIIVRFECSPPVEGKEKKRLGPRREDGPPKEEKSSGGENRCRGGESENTSWFTLRTLPSRKVEVQPRRDQN